MEKTRARKEHDQIAKGPGASGEKNGVTEDKGGRTTSGKERGNIGTHDLANMGQATTYATILRGKK